MEVFFVEYGFLIDEGVVFMCLVEVLLCVLDVEIIDVLIEDKIVLFDWGKYFGQFILFLVNVFMWVLMLIGKVFDDGDSGVISVLCGVIKCFGEFVICIVVGCVMKEMGCQFVLGEMIEFVMKCVQDMEV